MAALNRSDEGVKLLAWAAGQKGPVNLDDGKLEFDNIKEYNRALARTMVTTTRGSARTTVQQAGAGNGLDAWRLLVSWNQPRSATDKASSMLALIKPERCKSLPELKRGIEQWEVQVREHMERFEPIPESLRIAGLLQMIPETLYELRFKGKAFENYLDLKAELSNYLLDRRTGTAGPTPMEIGGFEGADAQDGLEGLKTQVNELHAFVKRRKGQGKWGRTATEMQDSGHRPHGPLRARPNRTPKARGRGKARANTRARRVR